MKTGYISGITGETIKVEVMAETLDGKYVLRRADGQSLFLWDKEEFMVKIKLGQSTYKELQEEIANTLYFRHEALAKGAMNVLPWHKLPADLTKIWLDDAEAILSLLSKAGLRLLE